MDSSSQEQPHQIDDQFIEAIASNDLDKFKALLESSFNTDPEPPIASKIDVLNLSLTLAAEKGHAEILEFLLKQEEIQVNKRNADGFTALHFAAANGHLKIVELLLNCKDVEVWTAGYRTNPLHLAAKNGHLSVVKAFISKREISTIVYCYCSDIDSDDEDTANFIDSWNENSFTSLHLAAQNGHAAVVEFLLNKGAKISLTGAEDTPLHLAAKEGHVEVVRLLLFSDIRFYSFYRDEEVWKPCVKTRNENRMIPLHYAAENGHDKVIEKLLSHYATNVNQTSMDGSSPLHLAAKGGHANSIRQLLSSRKVRNLKDGSGKTALDIARENQHTDCVQILSRRFRS